MKTILVTGGAGYIGSAMVHELIAEKYRVVVLDDLSMGHRRLVPKQAEFFKGDLKNITDCRQIFKKYKITAVMHFAASALVGESVAKPLLYYQNNTAACVNLLNAMQEARVHQFIFSSTCATYGEPKTIPMPESHPQDPTNPYGRSKLMIEWMLRDLAKISNFSYIALRYFNAAGAHSSGLTGEIHEPEAHLIPNILKAVRNPKRKLVIFGGDFDTPDGTCMRDYVHIQDITHAHFLALKALGRGVKNEVFNLGLGRGISNLEILKMAEKVTGKKIGYKIGARRPGDPSRLVADNSKAKKILGWVPERGLEEIVRSAWEWEQKQ